MTTAVADELAYVRHVRGGVDQFEGQFVGLGGFPDTQPIPEARIFEARNDGSETIRPLGVSGAGVVSEKRL